MERVASGIAGFDRLVQGGFPAETSIVLQGPPGQEKLTFALAFLAEGLRTGGSGLVVVSSQSPESLLKDLRRFGVDVDRVVKENRLRIVDWFSWGEETVTDVEERGAVVRSSVDLTNAGVAVSRGIAALQGEGPHRAIVEMLSPASNVYEVGQVYAFAQSTKRKFDRFHFTALFLLENEMHTAAALTTLHQPFDGVVEIERSRSGDRIVRKIGILHLKDTTPVSDFVPFEFTDQGIRVGLQAPTLPVPPPETERPGPAPMPAPPPRPRPSEARANRIRMIQEIARERLRIDPEDRDALFTLAAAQTVADDPRSAVRTLERLETIDPDYPGLWAFEMKLFARLGDAERWQHSRQKALQVSAESEGADATPCPFCKAPVSPGSAQCPHCMADLQGETDLFRGLEDLVRATVQEMVQEELGAKPPPPVPQAPRVRPVPKTPVLRPVPKAKGLTNGLVLERRPFRPIPVKKAGRGNGLTNGLHGRTNGLTNGLRGRTNGLTNGLGRTNGLTNGLGRTNGLTNGLRGRTNGLRDGAGRSGPIRPASARTRFRQRLAASPWTRYGIPLAVVAVLIVPLFILWASPGAPRPVQIDGNFGDWATQSLVGVPTAASANPNIQIVRIGVVDNVDDLAFYVEVAGTMLQGGGVAPGVMDTVRLFVDVDNSSATGYQVRGIGADRLLEVSGYGRRVLKGDLYEFDANRNGQDWNGWIKGTPIQAAASGARLEVQASWIAIRQGSVAPVAAVATQSWDGVTDETPVLLSLSRGTLVVQQRETVSPVLSGAGASLLTFTATAFRQSVTFDSLTLEILGTAQATAASSLELLDGSGNVLSQVAPAARSVTFSFGAQQVDPTSSRTYSIRGDFAGASGDTFGVRIAAREDVGARNGIVSLDLLPAPRSLGYVGVVPSGPRVDGAFEEWAFATPDATGETSTRGNANIDLAQTGAIHNGSSLYLYTDVSGRIFAGTGQPANPQSVPATNTTPPADTDRDTVPDAVDPMPYDFNNDGIPDSQTGGDYDGDGITDYGFLGGTDSWLNTTLPLSFPAPYAGLSVSVYIGPTSKPPLLGEDVLRIFLDIDNSTWSGFSIGGLGADRLIEVRGECGEVTQSALLSFSGSFPGQWSWSPVSPVTVAPGYHAVELSVPGNASHVYVETGDFWGSVDSTSGPPAVPTPSSFVVAAANSILSVPWVQTGPQVSATLIDPNSNAPTTVYNHQRKVVRAGDVAGQTACDATNSDGCWYVVFYDQLAQDTFDSAPSTETLAAGTRPSGTFPTDVVSSNNAYIDYREANTGAPTTVTRNPTAVGTLPGCTFGTCPNGASSDNTYATSSTQNQHLSFKTFGFAVPSGATVSSVRVGIEAFAAATDGLTVITLSWNAGGNYCSNTKTYNTLPTADPNSYTYFDLTTCTSHTWAQADFTGDSIAFDSQYLRVGSPGATVSVDAVAVEVTYTPIEYTLAARHDFSSVPAGDTITLGVEAYHSAGEDFGVQVLTPPATWNTRITVTATADPNAVQVYVLVTTEFNSGSPSIRFVDTVTADLTPSDIWVDLSILTTTMTKSPSTETMTTGTKVSGTFATDISSSNNAYIDYREANTGTQTTVTKNAGAVGTTPACGFTNCANAEASDNAYATSSVDATVLSLKTFSFSLPSGITIDSVRAGIEGLTQTNDRITLTLSWNSGTTFCSNGVQLNLPVSDPNSYSYADLTSCTGHTWAQTDFTGDAVVFKGTYTAQGGADSISIDAAAIEVKYTPLQYQLSVRHDFANVPAGDVYTLKVEAHHSADENMLIEVLTPPSTWNARITVTATADPNTAQTYALTTTEYNSGAPAIRFVDASGSDTTQSDLWIDQAVITTTSYWDRIYIMRSLDTSGSTWGSQILLASGRTGGDPLLYNYDSAEPSIAMDSSGYLQVVWVSAGSTGNQQTLNRVRYTKTTVAYPTQSQLASAANWQSVTAVDDASLGYMPSISTGTSNSPHIAWSGSKTSGTVYYKNMYGGAWKPTVSWGSTYTGISVDVSPQNNYVNLVRYYEAATNEIQYTVCKNLATNNCDAASEFTKWDGTAGYDSVAASVESGGYPSLATTYEVNGDLWIAYAKDVDGTTRAIYVRFLDYPSSGFAAAETVDSLSGTRFTRPTIGVDKNGNLNALYVASSGPQLYYKVRTSGTWGLRTALDSSTDYPSLIVRSPNDATYGSNPGAVYWKSSTSETYFVAIPEFESIVVPIVSVLALVLTARRRLRGRTRLPDEEVDRSTKNAR